MSVPSLSPMPYRLAGGRDSMMRTGTGWLAEAPAAHERRNT